MIGRLGLYLIRIDEGLHHSVVAVHRALRHIESAVAQNVVLPTAVLEDVTLIAAVDLLWAWRLVIITVSASWLLLEHVTVVNLLFTLPHLSILVLVK